MKLTPNFSAEEFDVHEPFPPALYAKRQQLADLCQWFRNLAGVPALVSSAYRSPARNAAVGGADHSQHELGEAADLVFLGITDRALTAKLITAEALGQAPAYGQFIVYADTGHVHVSLGTRREKLAASKPNGVRQYSRVMRATDVPLGIMEPTVMLGVALVGLAAWWLS